MKKNWWRKGKVTDSYWMDLCFLVDPLQRDQDETFGDIYILLWAGRCGMFRVMGVNKEANGAKITRGRERERTWSSQDKNKFIKKIIELG